MTFDELNEKYKNTKKGYCACCGQTLEAFGGNSLGDFFVMDKEGNFYCTECDTEFEDGDSRIFDPDEEFFDDCSLEELLDKLSGILDQAYEFAEDDEEKSYICKVEDALHDNLRKAGLIK